jgi:HSP20 family protein
MAQRSRESAVTRCRAPFREFDLLERLDPFGGGRMRNLFDEMFGAQMGGGFAPAVDVCEDDSEYVIAVDLPGASREDLTVELSEGMLKIRGEKKVMREGDNAQPRHRERSYGSFTRSFSLPAAADWDKPRASHQDGVLRVHIPKREETKPRTVATPETRFAAPERGWTTSTAGRCERPSTSRWSCACARAPRGGRAAK